MCPVLDLKQATKIDDDAISSLFKYDVVVGFALVLELEIKLMVYRFPFGTSTMIQSQYFVPQNTVISIQF